MSQVQQKKCVHQGLSTLKQIKDNQTGFHFCQKKLFLFLFSCLHY